MRVQINNLVLSLVRYFVKPTYWLVDVCMVLSLESGAGQPRLCQQGLHDYCVHHGVEGSPNRGGPPRPRLLSPQGHDSLHSDGSGCNTTRPKCFSPKTSLGANFYCDGEFCFQMCVVGRE